MFVSCGNDESSSVTGASSGSGGAELGGSGGVGGSAGATTGGAGGSGGSNAGGAGGSHTGGAGGSGGVGGSGASGGFDAGSARGHIAYRVAGGHIYLQEAAPGAPPFDLSEALDAISPGSDADVNISPDGKWLSIVTDRFGCSGWECLVVSDVELTQPKVVKVGGAAIHPGGVAIGSGGDLLVFEVRLTHEMDLLVSVKTGDVWSAPESITTDSTFEYNSHPALSDDGQRVVFDCSSEPYGAPGTHLCEVRTDGTGFRVLVSPSSSPNGQPGTSVHSGDYAPDGSVVFEGAWGSEQIWRLAPGASVPQLVAPFTNDNTPCVLPDGRIASLWLNSPDNPAGMHELMVMNPDGSDQFMLRKGVDLLDHITGCGE